MKRLRSLHVDVSQSVERKMRIEDATRSWLLYVVVPLWLGSGLADWYTHRKTHIERTSGARESLLHLAMLSEAGVPTLLGLFCEVNAGVLLSAFAALVVHELTAIWDVAYTETRRRVTPMEQHIHSFLEVTPLMAVSFLTILHWDQAKALFGRGRAPADFSLRLKRHPLGPRYVIGLLATMTICGLLPYTEELLRCLRALAPTLAPQPEPAVAATPSLRIPETGAR